MKGAVGVVRCSRVPPLLWIPASGLFTLVVRVEPSMQPVGKKLILGKTAMPFSVPTVTKDIILRPSRHSA